MERIKADFLIVVLWSLTAKCAKGYARDAKFFLCLFFSQRRKGAKFCFVCWFWPRIWRMKRIKADFLIVVLWSLTAKCAKGYERGAKFFLCFFFSQRRKGAKFCFVCF
jgi:hypothetical protein